MATPAIATTGLTKSFGRVRAVDGLDLEVPAGQVFGFLGPNGAGKTTTIRMLLDLCHPTAGRARVLGLDARRDAVAVHARSGYLPGDLALPRRMTGAQVLDWFATARGGSPALRRALVERFDVVVDRRVQDLSTGNRKKLGIVLAFMHRPELLILDEPTSGLDPLMQAEFQRLLHETTAEGRTVFLSSHELDEVQRVADRVAIIRDGRLVVSDSVQELRRRAPHRVEVRFRRDVAARDFAGLDGVSDVVADRERLTLQVTGDRLAPLLRAIADHDPVEIAARRADLDELFLGYYGDGRRDAR